MDQLWSKAKEAGLTNFTAMRKSQLVQFIRKKLKSNVGYLLQLYRQGVIDGKALNKGLKKLDARKADNDIYLVIKKIRSCLKEIPGEIRQEVKPEIKALKIKIDKLSKDDTKITKITETYSALKGFTKLYRIRGTDGYNPKTFMDQAKPLIVKTMKDNRNTKCNLILLCIMIRDRILKKANEYSYPHIKSDIITNLNHV